MPKDFSSYLDVDMDSIPKSLPSLPPGHFFATVKSHAVKERKYRPDEITPVVELTFSLTGPDTDVEESELPPNGAAGRFVTKDYVLNDADKGGLIRLRRVAETACKLDVTGRSIADILDDMVGCDVKVHNTPKPGKEEGAFYNNIDQVLPVD